MVEGVDLHNDLSRTTPQGLISFAKKFLESSIALDESLANRNSIVTISTVPANFLLGQAIELALKSYLLFHGLSLNQLKGRSLGHNLGKLLNRAKQLGLTKLVEFTDEQESAIELLDNLYASKELQYVVTGAKKFPKYEPLKLAAEMLVSAIAQEVV